MKPQKAVMRIGAALCVVFATGNTVAFDPNNPIPDPILKNSIAQPSITIELESIATGVSSPNFLTHAGDGSNRLFVLEQPGQIAIIENGALLPTPFLDVSSRLPALGVFGGPFDERGLLGVAFHPDYSNNGKLYTFTSEIIDGPADFTVPDLPPEDGLRHQSVIAEWQVDANNANAVDTSTRRDLMRIDNPQFNHNGGMLNFAQDGTLFISIGDGGSANDLVLPPNDPGGHGPQGNGQDPSNVLGTILRIDVDGNNSTNGQYGLPVAAPFSTVTTDPTGTIPDEVFAYGFRNPYRFSFDSETGELIAGDVGQGDIEEVDIVTAGGNFGWRFKEGSFAFDFNTTTVSDDLTGLPPGLIDPVLEYDHDEGISVIGGFVYRGSAIPELTGKYVFGDFSESIVPAAGRLFYGDLDTGLIQEFILGLDDRTLDLYIKGFGQDADGELYVLTDEAFGAASQLGGVFKLVAAPVPVPAAVWLFGSAIAALSMRRRRPARR